MVSKIISMKKILYKIFPETFFHQKFFIFILDNSYKKIWTNIFMVAKSFPLQQFSNNF
jgi:hypothetical protein